MKQINLYNSNYSLNENISMNAEKEEKEDDDNLIKEQLQIFLIQKMKVIIIIHKLKIQYK